MTFVAIVPSVDVVICDESKVTSEWSDARFKVGVPNSTVLSETVTFWVGSTFAKNRSIDDRNAPVSSTVKVCASGSQGWGGLRTITSVCRNVSTIPFAS